MSESPRSARAERARAGSPRPCRGATQHPPGRRASLAFLLGVLALQLSAAAAQAESRDALTRAAPRREALPRQFSVEVAPGGSVYADGTRLGGPAELSSWAGRAVRTARFSGAVVFGDPARDGSAIADAVERLRAAGFTEVRSAGRPAPRALSAAQAGSGAPPLAAGLTSRLPSRASAPAPAQPIRAGGDTPPARRSTPPEPPVALASVGLHVGSELNRPPHRGRLLRLFEAEFGAFRRCHRHAERHDGGASFGVDLLVPKEGGRAQVREVRTRLKSQAFQTCMRAAFEAVRFPPPATERPEIVSYSLIFKPPAR